MGEMISRRERAAKAYILMDCIENREEIKRKAQARINQQSNGLLEAK